MWQIATQNQFKEDIKNKTLFNLKCPKKRKVFIK